MRFVVAVALSAGIVLVAGQVDAQYRYTNDKGTSKVTQYKLDVPASYRDAAIWIGPTGIGKPALSEEQRQVKQRDDAYRRIGAAHARLAAPYKKVEAAVKKPEAAAAADQQHKAPDPTPQELRAQRDAVAAGPCAQFVPNSGAL